jgi:pyrroloquinoline quinone (PQQ) biosynthesis protein C
LQERAIEILKFKLDVLWQMSDAMALRYMPPSGVPR